MRTSSDCHNSIKKRREPVLHAPQARACPGCSFQIPSLTYETAKLFIVEGPNGYLQAVEDTFGANVDYAILVKPYGISGGQEQERRYSPGKCCRSITGLVCSNPAEGGISTSFVERQNLTMRMSMRPFTRLSNKFSKTVESHDHAIAVPCGDCVNRAEK